MRTSKKLQAVTRIYNALVACNNIKPTSGVGGFYYKQGDTLEFFISHNSTRYNSDCLAELEFKASSAEEHLAKLQYKQNVEKFESSPSGKLSKELFEKAKAAAQEKYVRTYNNLFDELDYAVKMFNPLYCVERITASNMVSIGLQSEGHRNSEFHSNYIVLGCSFSIYYDDGKLDLHGCSVDIDNISTPNDEQKLRINHIITMGKLVTSVGFLNDVIKTFKEIHSAVEFRDSQIEAAQKIYNDDLTYWLSKQ